MRGRTYKIKPLKGSEKYDQWSQDIQALDHCWLLTMGKDITPNVPRGLPGEKLGSTRADATIMQRIAVTEEMKDAHEARLEKYWDKLLDCDDKLMGICHSPPEN